jgi:AhpD family alkylhydroperoxidase
MKALVATLALSILPVVASSQSVNAQDAPQFMKDTFPEPGLSAAWQESQALSNPNAALDAKTRELIGLGVAAQIPCTYCVYYHTKAARQAGATDAQIKEAVAAAAETRKWSTMLNGNAYNVDDFKKQIDAAFGGSGKTQ